MKFADARRIALSLPDVTEQPHFHLASFRVHGRIFVTVPPEQDHLRVFVTGTAREQALDVHPEFVEKLFWGGKVVGVKVNLANAKPAAVRDLIREAHAGKSAR
jgi:hypothetical protein